MRLAPVPIRYAELFPNRLGDLLSLLGESSLPTHASPQCQSACAYLGLLLAALIRGEDRRNILDPAWPLLAELRKSHALHPEIDAVAAGSFRGKQPPEIAGSGYVVESLEAALWAFHDAKDFRQAVLRAVNLGDDADTTGAVCGQLAGAYWGEDGIPDKWREGLARKDMIEKALAGLLTSVPTPSGLKEPAKSRSVDAKRGKKAPSAAESAGLQSETRIHPERFPPKPVFLTSNKARRKANEQAVEEALDLAQKADLQGLTAMKLQPSPKLKLWHVQLAAELAKQLEPHPQHTDAGSYQLADALTKPPIKSSYWVVPGLLLAGEYPGDPGPDKHRAKVQALLDAGIRTFVNLMEEEETNHVGQPFVSYDGLASQLCPDVSCCRHAIRDLSAPTRAAMTAILDAIDDSLAAGRATYVHCWGGVGRTGTVVACWLLRHAMATKANVFEVLASLREQDCVHGRRQSPESTSQRQFVGSWPRGR